MKRSLRGLRVSGRRAAALAAGGVVALAASGCSSFINQPTGSQAAPNGDVAVTSDICLAGFDSDTQPSAGTVGYSTSCQPQAASPEGAEQGQMLIAYEIPNGSGAPAQLTTPDLSGVTFTPSSAYVAWLNTNDAPKSGFQWAGYMSSEFADANPEAIDLTADFTLPTPAGGGLYTGPYVVKQVVVGDRADGPYASTTLDPTRTLDCSQVVQDVISVPSPGTSQTLSASPTGCQNDASTTPISVATQEFSVSAPSPRTVQAGTQVTLPFTIQFVGAAAGPFPLSASTSSNNLLAVPVNSNYAPSGSGSTEEDVTVPVPAGLPGGSYTVTLNVGGLGSGTATLQVIAAPGGSGSGPAPGPTGPTTTISTTSTTPSVNPQRTHLVRPKLSSVSLRNTTLRLTQRLNIAAVERLTLEFRQGHRWITLKVLSFREPAGQRTLSLHGLFAARLFKRPGQYRLLVQAFNGTLKSNLRTVHFTIKARP